MPERPPAPFLPPLAQDEERRAVRALAPGVHLKPPPPPHALGVPLTSDDDLFETIHMASVDVDAARWRLQVDGLVRRPFSIDLAGLQRLPATSVTAFHECYGSPLAPATGNLWRVGNVRWTGVPLATLLAQAGVDATATHVWSDGLDSGRFGGRTMDRYRKDLPLAKALSPEVLVAYAMNGAPLSRARGGPVRLVVPGWFGTNMTKWLCRLSLQAGRADGPFTTTWYNRAQPAGRGGAEPVWAVEPNALITAPAPGEAIAMPALAVRGWAWGDSPIVGVDLSLDGGASWHGAQVAQRVDHGWQAFEALLLPLATGPTQLVARARDAAGRTQALQGTRNAAHAVPLTWRPGAGPPTSP